MHLAVCLSEHFLTSQGAALFSPLLSTELYRNKVVTLLGGVSCVQIAIDWCKIGARKKIASESLAVIRFQHLESLVDIDEVRRSSRRTSIP